MKFIVDAQLPLRLSKWLNGKGIDCIHTLNLPKGNASEDKFISELADREKRIVISKDHDFWDDHILQGSPPKLLVINTGNIINSELIRLFEQNFEKIQELFQEHDLVELNWSSLIVHGE